MVRLIDFIDVLFSLYTWVVLASVIMSWLIGFNVVNAYNPTVRAFWNALLAVTEPLLRPIRRVLGRILPDLRGLDISPIFLLLAILFIRTVILGNLRDMLR